MKGRRLFVIVMATILVIVFGGATISWLYDNCSRLSSRSCYLMWGATFIITLGGVWIAETLLRRKDKQEQRKTKVQDSQEYKTDSNWYVWFRPIAWVTLSSLLAGLPLLVQGAYIVTVGGIITGMALTGLRRGLMNRLPPIE